MVALAMATWAKTPDQTFSSETAIGATPESVRRGTVGTE
jgi:hypothetical protein